MSYSVRCLGLVLGMILCSLSIAETSAAPLQGVFMVVKGDVKISHGAGAAEVAKVGGKVTAGDTIVAGADSRAKVVMSDKNVFNISPDSKFVIEKYTNSKDDKNVEVKVEFGKVRSTVEERYDGEKSKFNVKTPSAVAGVRGTDFVTSYSASTKESSVITFRGTVAVGLPGPNGTISNPVYVKQGQSTSSQGGASPSAPKAVPPADLEKANSSTSADSGGQKSDSGSRDSSGGKKSGGSSSSNSSSSSSSSSANSSGSGNSNLSGTTSSSSGSSSDSSSTRSPASASSGSMISNQDLGTAPAATAGGVPTSAPPPPSITFTAPPVVAAPPPIPTIPVIPRSTTTTTIIVH